MLVLLPLLTGLLLILYSKRSQSWRKAIIDGSVFWGVLVTIITESLSLGKHLNSTTITLAWFACVMILAFILYPMRNSLKIKRPAWPRHPLIRLFWGWGIGILVILWCLAVFVPPNNTDSFIYHLPRILHWLQNQTVDHYPTAILRQLFQGPWSSFALLHIYALVGSDRLLNLLQWTSLIGCLIGVSLIAQELGINRWGQLWTVLFALTLPMAILQSTTTQNDLVCSFWLICFAYYTVSSIQSKTLSTKISLRLGLSLGLLFLTKGTSYILATPLIIWLGITHFKSILKPSSIGFALVPILVNFGFYQRNFSAFQWILYTDISYVNSNYTLATIVSNLTRSIALHIPCSLSTVSIAYRFVWRIHELINLSNQLDSITFASSPNFMVFFIALEDLAGNPLHFYLISITTILIAFRLRRSHQVNPIVTEYFVVITLTFILLCLMLKWNIWISRLHTPYFLAIAPIIGYLLQAKKIRWLAVTLCLCLLLNANYYIFENVKKPFWGSKNIFITSRMEKYFHDVPGRKDYQATAKYLSEHHCQDIGLMINDSHLEYLFWQVLKQENAQLPQIKHILVNNPAGKIPESGAVCAIARFGQPVASPLVYQGQAFSHHWQPHATTLTPEYQIHIYTPTPQPQIH
ncbi:hypothetical protein VB712_10680 [Spirulina sp. CCNP1310]|uniref:hypothetical protein n=1 Tax=Spirulina sp. CCNP1310 TaxID=3110249 RepID=UPI002B1ED12E|nr:hypothetical protein [Spirulina sp. CCNP1310]MEA5419687.1 hypothetical protein [Spirulina sp. CCNP1310]